MKSFTIITALATLAAAMPAANRTLETRGRQCISFGSYNNWYYRLDGPWGSGTGQNPSQLCFDTNNESGGAMFFGFDPNPGAGNSKLECFFPDNGESANCDISLVDGYSMSMVCYPDGHNSVGGTGRLYNNPCPDWQGDYCRNDNGYALSQNDVAPFFQAGIQNGNNYCIWQNCEQYSFFPTYTSITCEISY